jgi:2-dehydro-3-deoxygluconokinase
VRGGERMGIYFLETGASQRSAKVIYDRAHSAVTTLTESELDMDAIFDGADWFHWTGITPALGPVPRQTLVFLCQAARRAGVTVSCDLNYRAKLWTTDEAQRVMRPLMEHVDICIANEEDAQKTLGMETSATNVESGRLEAAEYTEILGELKSEYGFSAVAITLRESYSASHNGWSAIMLDEKDCAEPYRSSQYEIEIVDRVGAGDAFAGGLIAGLLKKDNTRDALEFAVAASCLKQTIPGDFNAVSEQEVDRLVSGTGSGRVER